MSLGDSAGRLLLVYVVVAITVVALAIQTAARRPLFPLDRWGVPVNALALLYGLFMTINLAWPRAEVYDPAGGRWYFQWFTVLFLGVTLVLGGAYRVYRARTTVAEAAAYA